MTRKNWVYLVRGLTLLVPLNGLIWAFAAISQKAPRDASKDWKPRPYLSAVKFAYEITGGVVLILVGVISFICLLAWAWDDNSLISMKEVEAKANALEKKRAA